MPNEFSLSYAQKYSKRNPTFRYWCWTTNNYTNVDIRYIKERLLGDANCAYCIAGLEVGEEGTPHLQCYGQFPAGIRQNKLRKLFDHRLNGGSYSSLTSCNGDALSNRAYCWKGVAEKKSWPNWETEAHSTADYFEVGTINLKDKQGNRSDLAVIKELLDNNMMQTVKDNFFGQWCRYRKSFETYMVEAEIKHVRSYKKRTWETLVQVNYGEARIGKTREFWDTYGFDGMDAVTYKNGFIMGYYGSPVVLLDDFDSSRMPRGLFLQLTDRYPLTVNIKGGSMQWNPVAIMITSNYAPDTWYEGPDPAVLGRINEIKHFTHVDDECKIDIEKLYIDKSVGRIITPTLRKRKRDVNEDLK